MAELKLPAYSECLHITNSFLPPNSFVISGLHCIMASGWCKKYVCYFSDSVPCLESGSGHGRPRHLLYLTGKY